MARSSRSSELPSLGTAVRRSLEKWIAGLLFVLGALAPAISVPLRLLILEFEPHAERLGAGIPEPIRYLSDCTEGQLHWLWMSVAAALLLFVSTDIARDWRNPEREPLRWPSIGAAVLVALICCGVSIIVLIGVVDWQSHLFRPK